MSHIVNEIPWWASGASLRKRRFNHMAPQAQHTLEEDRLTLISTPRICEKEVFTGWMPIHVKALEA